MSHDLPLMIALILIASIACQWIAWRVRLPAIIFLLMTGIISGPVLGLVDPEAILGDLFFPFVSMSVAIILFEGSLTLNFREISGLQGVVRNMVSFGMLVTWLITAVVARFAIGLSWPIALLFGAITVVSGPTVIAPLMRTVRPTAAVANILRWEGIVIDPIGASLAVLIYEFIITGGGQNGLGHTFITIGKLLLVGAAIGCSGGYIFGQIIKRHWLPEFLHNVTALTLVIASFNISNTIQDESGLVTVTIMGIWLANMNDVDMEEILNFKESISVLLISLLFIMLAARLNLNALLDLGWRTIFLFIAVQFLARPLNIVISAAGSKLTWPERNLLAWIAPRGIVAAAISALFAVQLEKAGHSDAALLVPLTFFVIIATVVVQSITARPLAKWLGVAEPDPKGFLIIGANLISREIGKAFLRNDVKIMLTDTNWDNVSKAKKEGLPAYFGNPLSEHAERHMSMSGIGRVLALAPHSNINVSAMMHFRAFFDRQHLFLLQTKSQEDIPERSKLPKNQGRILFGQQVTFSTMYEALAKGGKIHTTKLTEQFSFNDFMAKHGNSATPLFSIDENKNVRVFCDNDGPAMNKGKNGSASALIYLLNAQAEEIKEEEMMLEQIPSQGSPVLPL